MEVKERIIDLRQYFLYLWENAIIILLVSLAFTCGMAGYSYKKQKAFMNSTSSVERSILNSVISQNHDAFYSQNPNNPSNSLPFTDAEPPANTYNSSARLFVDFDFSSIEGNTNLDFSQMSKQLQQDATLLLVSDEALNSVIEKLNLHQYDDMSDITSDELKWLINKNFLGANVMQIVVTDVNPERSKLIAENVVDEFLVRSKNFATIDSVKVIDNASTPKGGLQSSAVQTSINKKSLLKYGIVGFVGGFILMAIIYLIIFIFKDTVRNAIDLNFADLRLYGYVAKNEKKKTEDCKRLAYDFSVLEDIKSISIVPVDKYSESEELLSKVNDELKSIGVKEVKVVGNTNMKDSADATLATINSDAAVILMAYGKTRMNDLIFTVNEINKTKTNLLGGVIIDKRH